MRRFFTVIALAMMSIGSMTAQSALELAKQQKELNAISRKMLNEKPTKEAKKQAKVLKKAGWLVPAGSKSIEKQLTESQLLEEELMVDELGNPTKRFIMHSSSQVAGTFNASFAAARNAATVELAAALRTQVAAAMQSKLDNSQSTAITAVTVDKFNERAKAIVDQSLTNVRTLVTLYKVLPNNNYEVQVRMAYDKKELSASMKRKMQQELEIEGDELNSIVDDVLTGNF